jgi:hypothetical protein
MCLGLAVSLDAYPAREIHWTAESAMTVATALDVRRQALAQDQLVYRLVGLALATVLPALFWVAIAATVSQAMGAALSAPALAITGAAITLFLAAVCAPIMLKARA